MQYKGHYFVIDTSALLFDPSVLTYFSGNTAVIPVSVIQELDKHKDRIDHIGSLARLINRQLYDLKKLGNLNSGVKDEKSLVTIKVVQEQLEDVPHSLDKNIPDDRILSVCFTLIKQKINIKKIHLISNDLNLSLKASAYDIDTFDFQPENKYLNPTYTGFREIKLSEAMDINSMFSPEGHMECPIELNAEENECFVVTDLLENKEVFKCRHKQGSLYKIKDSLKCYKIKPLNNEQLFALDLLLDPEIKLVTLTGLAGSGKTLLSVAAGLVQSIEPDYRKYERLIISRSLVVLSGRDKMGFLPGDIKEKLDPYLIPLRDAMDFILGEKSNALEYLTAKATGTNINTHNKPKVEIEPLQFIKGRTLRNAFFIVDEAQNLSLAEVKTIVSRIGENSKIVLLGDSDQIDNPYLNKTNNGLSQVIEKFKGSKLYGHVSLKEGVRSALAHEAALRL